MELYIAGGCGEHGRNCFYVKGERSDFLVDCGIMAGVQDAYPHLPPQAVPKIEAVFLTHSHSDHTGALPWLYANGFDGTIIASRHTLQQLALKSHNCLALEELCAPLASGRYFELKLRWGKSGHCLGSVWYQFKLDGRKIIFSGDYTENSPIYQVDRIRGRKADLAVLDCAYGKSTVRYADACEEFVAGVEHLLAAGSAVVLPVPRYGRGLDLFYLLLRAGAAKHYYGDAHFLEQIRGMSTCPAWYKDNGLNMARSIEPYNKQTQGIIFLSDPQLHTEAARAAVNSILAAGGKAVMTGTAERGSCSAGLIAQGKMLVQRYPAHLRYAEYQNLIAANSFARAIPYHSPEFACAENVITIE